MALFLYGRCAADRASSAELQLQRHFVEDSIERKAWHRERLGLERQNEALRGDSAVLALRLRNASKIAQDARRRVDSLLSGLPDSTLGAIRGVLTADSTELASCQAVVANAEQRVSNCAARIYGDSIRLAATEALLDTTRQAWQKALHPNVFQELWNSRRTTLPLIAVIAYLAIRH